MESSTNQVRTVNDEHSGNSETVSTWEIIKEIGVNERHFNNLEIEYRKLASIWLLASFAGMGFVLKENLQMIIPPEIALIGIGLAGSIGIVLIWIVDLLVYHRLLDAWFIKGQQFEEMHQELPQIRQEMIANQKDGDVTIRLRWFYTLLMAAPVVFTAPVFISWCWKCYGFYYGILAVGILLLYIIIAGIIILEKTPIRIKKVIDKDKRN
jgi:hypothetical protein